MTVEIAAVGGWGEVGRNMTAVKVDKDVVIFDMGLHLPNVIKLNDDETGAYVRRNEAMLMRAGAIPQDKSIRDWRMDTIAIVISHAHLDHIGAVPYTAAKYNAPVICTPFAASLLRTIIKDERLDFRNKIIELRPGQTISLSSDLKIEFCHITHSTPQTVIPMLHTPYGIIAYGNDYKLDKHPTLGSPANYERLKRLGDKGVLALIQDCLYAPRERKTPSEQVAKNMLRDVLLDVDHKGKGIIVTTFASHIARVNTIVDFGRMLGRKVVLMSRSIAKYCEAARYAGVADLSKKAKIVKYGRQIRDTLKDLQHKKDKYLFVVSGHQGEPKAVLSRMVDGLLPWKFTKDDHVIFSSQIIPAEINIEQRRILDEKLRARGVRIFSDVHVSGHSSKEDLRDMLTMLRPRHVLPTHGDKKMVNAFNSLAKEMGYETKKTLHPLVNTERIVL